MPKYDISLFFSVANVEALERRLVDGERDDFMLTWRGAWHRYCNPGMSSMYIGEQDWLGARG